jgi:hypothetical protein
MVTFERRDEHQSVLPEDAQGAVGWMMALAPDGETARHLLVRDVEHCRLRVLEIDKEQEVFGEDEIRKLDEHLATNFREMEPGKRTVWGTIHCYKGEGEA